MKKLILLAALLVITHAGPARAGVNVNVDIGIPVAPQVVLHTEPRFIFSPTLGFYVSVGVPYDIVYRDHLYYIHHGDYWYSSHHYNGPWVVVPNRHIPKWLHRHRMKEIRHYRDTEYNRYEHNRKHFKGRWHYPAKEQRRHVKMEKQRYEQREDRRQDYRGEQKEERGNGHGHGYGHDKNHKGKKW